MSFLMGNGNSKSMSRSINRKLFGGNSKMTKQATADNKSTVEKLSSQFRVRLSKKTKGRLEQLSKTVGRTQASIVREGIDAFSSAVKGKKEIVIGGRIYTTAKTLKARKV